MKKGFAILTMTLLLSLSGSVVFAGDDWVEDEDVSGFYKRGVRQMSDEYGSTQGQPRQIERAPVDEMGGLDELGGLGSGLAPGVGNLNQVPPSNIPYPSSATQPPQKKGILGKAKSIGKSIISFPRDAFDDTFDNPQLWQSAGAAAGMGANAYMRYNMMKNNPLVYGANPYGSYLNPLSPYGGIGNPLMPYGAVNPLIGGFGNPYMGYGMGNPLMGGYGNPLTYGNPIYGGNYNPYGAVNPYMNYGNPYIQPYGGFGGLNPYNNFGFGSGFGAPGAILNPGRSILPLNR